MIKIKNRVNQTKYFTTGRPGFGRFLNWVECEYQILEKYISNNTSVLDVGSCDGRVGFMLIDDLGLSFKNLILSDYTDTCVNQIEGLIKDSEKETVKVRKEDITCLTCSDNSFDTVTAFGNVLTHIYDANYGGQPSHNKESKIENIRRAVNECYRVIKKEGMFLFELHIKHFDIVKNEISKIKDFELIEKYEISAGSGFTGNQSVLCCYKKK